MAWNDHFIALYHHFMPWYDAFPCRWYGCIYCPFLLSPLTTTIRFLRRKIEVTRLFHHLQRSVSFGTSCIHPGISFCFRPYSPNSDGANGDLAPLQGHDTCVLSYQQKFLAWNRAVVPVGWWRTASFVLHLAAPLPAWLRILPWIHTSGCDIHADECIGNTSGLQNLSWTTGRLHKEGFHTWISLSWP